MSLHQRQVRIWAARVLLAWIFAMGAGVAIMAGLLPILWGTGTGSEVMSRIAAPMGGE